LGKGDGGEETDEGWGRKGGKGDVCVSTSPKPTLVRQLVKKKEVKTGGINGAGAGPVPRTDQKNLGKVQRRKKRLGAGGDV